MRTAVWAFKRLDALGGKTGIVECASATAKDLLASGEVQDLRSGHQLKRVESDPTYQTKVMVPEDPKPKKPKAPKAPAAAPVVTSEGEANEPDQQT